MSESTPDRDRMQESLDLVEEQDDETRLRSLEDLHSRLESELERDDPSAEANRRS